MEEDERLDRLEQLMTDMIGIVGKTNNMITEIKKDIKEIKEDVEVLKEDVKEIKVGQERQDRILEILSAKSVETDSYIRDFKRLK